MEKLMKEQVDHTVDAQNKQKLQSALTGIVKMKENQWKDFNDSLKVTLERKSIRAFRVEEALETPQEWDAMAILIQYLCLTVLIPWQRRNLIRPLMRRQS